MQHRRERPTPRRQTHPPETPQTHLHPPPSPALSPNFKHSLLRAREASQSQPPFRKPAPFILPGIHRPLSLSLYLYPSLFLSLPFPLALSLALTLYLLSILSNRGSSLLHHSSRPDRPSPRATPGHHPSANLQLLRTERPSSYLQNHPLHSRARRAILLRGG